MATEKRKQLDWERIEAEYRAGKLSLREIAKARGCTEGAIRKKAKACGWERDLSAKIEQAVRNKEVRNRVRTLTATAEKDIVEANAQAIIDIKNGHRKDIQRATGLVATLFGKVEKELDIEPCDTKEPANQVDKLALPQLVDCTKKLTDCLKTLTEIESKAWGFDSDKSNPQDGLSALAELCRASQPMVIPSEEG